MNSRPHILAILIVVSVVTSAYAQGRMTYAPGGKVSPKELSIPRTIIVGDGPSTRNTRDYLHYSMGSNRLPQPTVANGAGVLGSSMYRPQGMTYRSSRPAAVPASGMTGPSTISHRVGPSYQPISAPVGGMAMPRRPHPTTPFAQPDGFEATTTGQFLTTLAEKRQALTTSPDTPITSLVPDVPGKYHELMQKGQQALKSGEFDKARQAFTMAEVASIGAPASKLGMMYASLPTAEGNYATAARDLAQAIRLFPDLLQLNIRSESLYASPDVFNAAVARLAEHVAAKPTDADAQFLLAYFRWREGNIDATRQALNAVLKNATDTYLQNTVDFFLAGATARPEPVEGERPQLAMPTRCSWAGLEIALPTGWQRQRPQHPEQVLLATSQQQAAPGSLAVFAAPCEFNSHARDFMDAALAHLDGNANFTDVTLVRRATGLIAEHLASGAMLKYMRNDKPMTAVAIAFVRQATAGDALQPDSAVAYMLAVEMPGNAPPQAIVPVIDAVAKSFRLLPFKRPLSLSDAPLALENIDAPVIIDVPLAWPVKQTATGLITGQLDYTIGGVACPLVEAGAVTLPQPISLDEAVKRLQARYATNGFDVQILDSQEATLARRKARRLVLRRTVKQGEALDSELQKHRATAALAKPGPPQIEVIYLEISGSGNTAAPAMLRFLTVVGVATDRQPVEALADRLAKTFTPSETPGK